jgi:sulfide dehydrogenase cytochrome subunit
MRLVPAIAMASLLAAPAAAESVSAANACAVCHGADLKGSGAVPSLRGRDAEHIRKALLEFRSGQRTATVMTRLAKGYSDAEIDAVSRQIGGLK